MNAFLREARVVGNPPASIFPCASIIGRTSSRALASTASSDQAAWPTRCKAIDAWAKPEPTQRFPRGPKLSSGRRHIQQNALHSIAPKAPLSPPFVFSQISRLANPKAQQICCEKVTQ